MIVLINPNSTAAMTETMRAVAQDQLGQRPLEAWTSTDGPPAIQGAADGVAAVPPLLSQVHRAGRAGARAIIIGCFDDTGLAEARAIAACPVIGIGQAGYHLAAATGRRFSVVTTLPVSVPVLEANITAYGLGPRLGRVRDSGVPVLEVETTQEPVISQIRCAEAEDDVDAVVLGCGGMASLASAAQRQTGLQVIDGVRAAAAAAGVLV